MKTKTVYAILAVIAFILNLIFALGAIVSVILGLIWLYEKVLP